MVIGRGLHVALTDEELTALLERQADKRGDFVSESFEDEKFGSADACETDKAWSLIHSALNGTHPDGPFDIGDDASRGDARFAIIGEEDVDSCESYYIGLIRRQRVPSVYKALSAIGAEQLREQIVIAHAVYRCAGTPDEGAEYATSWYANLVGFYSHAAVAGKHVIFTVVQ